MAIKSIGEADFGQFGRNINPTTELDFLYSYDYDERHHKSGNANMFMYSEEVYIEKLSGQSIINLSLNNGENSVPFYFDAPVMINRGVCFSFTAITGDFSYCIYYKSGSEVLSSVKKVPIPLTKRKIKCKNLILTSYKHMPDGLCFRPESQPFWELTYFAKGNYERVVDDNFWRFGGEAYGFVPANSVHSLKSDSSDAEFMAIMFEMDCPEKETLMIPRPVTPAVKGFLELISAKSNDNSPYAEDYILSLVSLIVAETLSSAGDDFGSLKSSVLSIAQMNDVIAKADRLIDENIFNPELSVGFIASKLYISTSYLYRCSMHKYKIGISENINNRKLKIACELIANGNYSFAEIANNLNFCSQSYFSTRFKKKYGMSPLQYSRQVMQKSNKTEK